MDSSVTIPACHRRTDRRTDGHDYGYKALQITASLWTGLDVVGRSGTVSFTGLRAMRRRPTFSTVLIDLAADGFRTVSTCGTTRCDVRWSVGSLESLPAVEQSLMLDRLRRSTWHHKQSALTCLASVARWRCGKITDQSGVAGSSPTRTAVE